MVTTFALGPRDITPSLHQLSVITEVAKLGLYSAAMTSTRTRQRVAEESLPLKASYRSQYVNTLRHTDGTASMTIYLESVGRRSVRQQKHQAIKSLDIYSVSFNHLLVAAVHDNELVGNKRASITHAIQELQTGTLYHA